MRSDQEKENREMGNGESSLFSSALEVGAVVAGAVLILRALSLGSQSEELEPDHGIYIYRLIDRYFYYVM